MKNEAGQGFERVELLQGLSDEGISHMFTCLQARRKAVSKGEIVFQDGEPANRFAIVLSGSIHVVRYSVDGRENLEETVGVGGLVGAAQVCASEPVFLASAVAAEPSEILILNGNRFLTPCEGACPVHVQLLRRLLVAVSKRGVTLQRKLHCLSQPTTSEKVLAFLRLAQQKAGTEVFEIPYTRQELADYLNVARAALSVEIGKLVKSGVLETDHKAFRFRNPSARPR